VSPNVRSPARIVVGVDDECRLALADDPLEDGVGLLGVHVRAGVGAERFAGQSGVARLEAVLLDSVGVQCAGVAALVEQHRRGAGVDVLDEVFEVFRAVVAVVGTPGLHDLDVVVVELCLPGVGVLAAVDGILEEQVDVRVVEPVLQDVADDHAVRTAAGVCEFGDRDIEFVVRGHLVGVGLRGERARAGVLDGVVDDVERLVVERCLAAEGVVVLVDARAELALQDEPALVVDCRGRAALVTE